MPAVASPMISLVMLVLLGTCLEPAVGVTCGDLQTHMTNEGCNTGNGAQSVSLLDGCPYNFNKPACNTAEPQAPRDLTDGASGLMVPKAATLNEVQAEALPLANVHFHLGAEHKSEEYANAADSVAYDATHSHRRLAANPRPGYMCSNAQLTDAQLAPYNFVHCKGSVEVGKSYEVHYVHSSAGYTSEDLAGVTDLDLMDDGLGGAANGRGMRNPMIVVQAQVFHIVNDGPFIDDMLHGWSVVGHENSVKYPGSTTGPSHDNQVCSPYAITWHVDKACHVVSPASFDNLCQQMKSMYNLESDLYPHGSRKIVDSRYVVRSEFVQPLASSAGNNNNPETDVAAKLGGGDTGSEAILLAGLVAASRM
mmetsp:Transcript_4212/g.8503  ORF Transcript_4212/g.8503 Transcript_4212/m.8503 type:complete len:365 (+) Transcript_4212:68-1162(+)